MKVRPIFKKGLERFRNIGDRTRPSPIKPIVDEEDTLAVVIVDAQDGSFQEATWVDEPVKYLRVSRAEAVKLAFKEMGVRPFAAKATEVTTRETGRRLWPIPPRPPKVSVELVSTDGSPYHPDWKVTIGDKAFFVDQDGNVRS